MVKCKVRTRHKGHVMSPPASRCGPYCGTGVCPPHCPYHGCTPPPPPPIHHHPPPPHHHYPPPHHHYPPNHHYPHPPPPNYPPHHHHNHPPGAIPREWLR
ncbi:unnamed protein product [Arctia plantaginis]|uniref:Uncharacterized protein n=1 Tax=Arctia plantaginis TaxID=874455 RepID=A0A8S1B8Z2_ARCPL|nr:unnamed protein product [Arctia plantaginis]